MKRRLLALVTLVVSGMVHQEALAAQASDSRIAAAQSAVVGLEVTGRDAQGTNRTIPGTGFFISADGYLLTAAHVLDTPQGWTEDAAGQLDRSINVKAGQKLLGQATLLYSDTQIDLALLRLDSSGPVAYLELGDSSLVADGASVMGFGYDQKATVYRGNVGMNFTPRYRGAFRLTNIPAQHGDSGGPVISEETWRVIGVIQAGSVVRLGRVHATPINFASKLLQLTHPPNSLALPRGSIIAWYAMSGPVPSGWAICDGTNGTPDLRDRFLMGVGQFTDVGGTGGQNLVDVKVPIPRLYLSTGGTDHGYALREDPGCGGCGVTNHRTGVHYLVNSFTKNSETTIPFDNRPSYMRVVFIMKL